MTAAPTPDLVSGAATFFVDLTDFGSDFFVTGAFDCTETGFAVLDDDFSDTTVETDVATLEGFADALLDDSATCAGTFALDDLTTVSLFFIADFAADFAAAGFESLTEGDRVFADFFIAFAMGSTTNQIALATRLKRYG